MRSLVHVKLDVNMDKAYAMKILNVNGLTSKQKTVLQKHYRDVAEFMSQP